MRNLNTIITMSLLFVLMTVMSVQAAPKLTIETNEFNFGYTPQNSKVSYSFWLKSTGDEELKILKVVPGCGCTKTPLEKDVLAPGDSTRLEVIFSTKKYKNRISKAPRIDTNEGGRSKKVRIITHVVSRPDSTYPIIISPYKLDLSQFTDKVRDEIKFTISNVSDDDLHPKLVYSPDGYFDLELPKIIAPGSKAEAILKINADKLGESFEKSITFSVDDENNSRFTIPVKRVVRSGAQHSSSTKM